MPGKKKAYKILIKSLLLYIITPSVVFGSFHLWSKFFNTDDAIYDVLLNITLFLKGIFILTLLVIIGSMILIIQNRKYLLFTLIVLVIEFLIYLCFVVIYAFEV